MVCLLNLSINYFQAATKCCWYVKQGPYITNHAHWPCLYCISRHTLITVFFLYLISKGEFHLHHVKNDHIPEYCICYIIYPLMILILKRRKAEIINIILGELVFLGQTFLPNPTKKGIHDFHKNCQPCSNKW